MDTASQGRTTPDNSFRRDEKVTKRPKIAQGEVKDGSGMYVPESTLPSKKGRFRAVLGISAFPEGGFQDGFGGFFPVPTVLRQYCPMTSRELTKFSVRRGRPHCRNRCPMAADSLIFLPKCHVTRSFFCQKSIATD